MAWDGQSFDRLWSIFKSIDLVQKQFSWYFQKCELFKYAELYVQEIAFSIQIEHLGHILFTKRLRNHLSNFILNNRPHSSLENEKTRLKRIKFDIVKKPLKLILIKNQRSYITNRPHVHTHTTVQNARNMKSVWRAKQPYRKSQ